MSFVGRHLGYVFCLFVVSLGQLATCGLVPVASPFPGSVFAGPCLFFFCLSCVLRTDPSGPSASQAWPLHLAGL